MSKTPRAITSRRRSKRIVFLVSALTILALFVFYKSAPHTKTVSYYQSHKSELPDKTPHSEHALETSVRKDKTALRKKNRESVPPKSPNEAERLKKLQTFFQNYFKLLAENKPKHLIFNPRDKTPKVDKPREYGDSGIVNIAIHDHGEKFPLLSEAYLNDSLKLDYDFVQDMKKSHANVVAGIPTDFPPDVYKGTGIAFIGGNKFSWLSLLSIENLRQTGSTVPVELIIPFPEDYEVELCQEILPKLNAKCVLLSDVIGEEVLRKAELKGYEYKALALVASSFENVLLVDSDNVIIKNPDVLFLSEPFISTGMVMWPDFWKRVTHPQYYEIAGIELGDKWIRNGIDTYTDPSKYSTGEEDPNSGIPLHDRAGAIPDGSTESGQILVNKKTHSQAILLSIYYNVYGQDFYYPLFAQGAYGEGDKETFLGAVNFYKLPFYQVKKSVDVTGYWKPDNVYQGCGMLQYDPTIDYKLLQTYLEEENASQGSEDSWLKKAFKGEKYDPAKLEKRFTKRNSRVMFVHANFPKLDPAGLKFNNMLFLNGDPEKRVRFYQDQSGLTFDFELRQWRIIKKYFCDRAVFFNYLSGFEADSGKEYCEFVKKELAFLEDTTDWIDLHKLD